MRLRLRAQVANRMRAWTSYRQQHQRCLGKIEDPIAIVVKPAHPPAVRSTLSLVAVCPQCPDRGRRIQRADTARGQEANAQIQRFRKAHLILGK
jgi:hypothetical protein